MKHFCVGICWARVGTIWGISWAILGFWPHVEALLGLSWAILGYVRSNVEPPWAILGPELAFVMDLGISVSLNFRPCKALGCVANVFDAAGILVCFFFLFFGGACCD